MDEEFGLTGLVEKEFKSKEPTYSSKDLRGLKVQHDQSRFTEGTTTILTLEDKGQWISSDITKKHAKRGPT